MDQPRQPSPSGAAKREGTILQKQGDKKPRQGDAPPSQCPPAQFAWERLQSASADDRIASKLSAMRIGIDRAKEVGRMFRLQCAEEQPAELAKMMLDLDRIVDKHEKQEVFIGVCGASGAGKSSIINALLDERNLLPEGHQDATTAVSCAISYNHSPVESKPYRGIVSLQSRDAVVEDVRTLLESIYHRALRRSGHNPHDATATASAAEIAEEVQEYEEQIRVGLDRFKNTLDLCFSELERAVVTHGPHRLTDLADGLLRRKPAIENFLAKREIDVSFRTAKKLSAALRPYLAAEPAAHQANPVDAFAAWPLIESARILLPNLFLRDGFVVVDLPGRGDVNMARVAVSELYESRLDVMLAVAPAIRAGSEATLSTILSNHQRNRIEIGGVLSSQRVAAVVSKIDDLKLGAYIPGSPRDVDVLRKSKSASEDEARRWEALREQLKNAHDSAELGLLALQDKRRDMGRPPAKGRNPAKGRMTKLINSGKKGLAEAKRLLREVDGRSAQATVAARLSGQQLMHCLVQARNRGLCQAISAGGTAWTADEPGSTAGVAASVQVICTSADALWRHKGGKPLVGFPQPSYSGIPSLRHWVRTAAAECGESHIDSVLASLRVNFRTIASWCLGPLRGVSAPGADGDIACALERCHAELIRNFATAVKPVCRRMGSVRLSDEKDRSQKRLQAKVTKLVQNWSLKIKGDVRKEPMACGTHAAILKRRGGKYASPKNNVEYYWEDDFALLGPFKHAWPSRIGMAADWSRLEVATVIDCVWLAYQQDIRRILDTLASCPLLAGELDATLGDVKHALRTTMDSHVDELQKSLCGAPQRLGTGSVRKFLQTKCEQTLGIVGSGCYRLRRQDLETDVPAGSITIFRSDLAQLESNVRSGSGALEHAALTSIKEAITRVQCSLTRSSSRESAALSSLRSEISNTITACFADWNHPQGTIVDTPPAEAAMPEVLTLQDLGKDHHIFKSHGANHYSAFVGTGAPAAQGASQPESDLRQEVKAAIEVLNTVPPPGAEAA